MNAYLNKIISLITLLSFLLYSCGGTYQKSDVFNIDKLYDDINSYSEDNPVQILLTTNEFYSGQNIHVNRDSTSWVDKQTKERMSFKTSAIHKIIIKNKISSATVGILFGALSVISIFYLLGFGKYRGHPDMRSLIIIVGIIGGGAIGGFFGAFQNNDHVFILNDLNAN